MASMIFLAFSSIAFILTFGVLFMLMPVIFGAFFSTFDNLIPNFSGAWRETYDEIKTLLQFVIPLMLTVGIFIFVLKILMNASARGGE